MTRIIVIISDLEVKRVDPYKVAQCDDNLARRNDESANTFRVVWVRNKCLDRARADGQVVCTLAHFVKVPDLDAAACSVSHQLP